MQAQVNSRENQLHDQLIIIHHVQALGMNTSTCSCSVVYLLVCLGTILLLLIYNSVGWQFLLLLTSASAFWTKFSGQHIDLELKYFTYNLKIIKPFKLKKFLQFSDLWLDISYISVFINCLKSVFFFK